MQAQATENLLPISLPHHQSSINTPARESWARVRGHQNCMQTNKQLVNPPPPPPLSSHFFFLTSLNVNQGHLLEQWPGGIFHFVGHHWPASTCISGYWYTCWLNVCILYKSCKCMQERGDEMNLLSWGKAYLSWRTLHLTPDAARFKEYNVVRNSRRGNKIKSLPWGAWAERRKTPKKKMQWISWNKNCIDPLWSSQDWKTRIHTHTTSAS